MATVAMRAGLHSSNTPVQSQELFGQVTDHLIGYAGQVAHFTKCDVFGKPDQLCKPSGDVDAKLGNQRAQGFPSLQGWWDFLRHTANTEKNPPSVNLPSPLFL
jgi:hypothetical protein